MASRISGTDVVDDNKKGIFKSFNPGQYAAGSEPSNPVEGDIIYNTTDKKVYVWAGSEWKPI